MGVRIKTSTLYTVWLFFKKKKMILIKNNIFQNLIFSYKSAWNKIFHDQLENTSLFIIQFNTSKNTWQRPFLIVKKLRSLLVMSDIDQPNQSRNINISVIKFSSSFLSPFLLKRTWYNVYLLLLILSRFSSTAVANKNYLNFLLFAL